MSAALFILGIFVVCLVFLFPVPDVHLEKEIIVLMRKRRLIAFENGRERFQFTCVDVNPSHSTKAGLFRFLNDATYEAARDLDTEIPSKLFFSKDGKVIDVAICSEPVNNSNPANPHSESELERPLGCVRISESDAQKLFPWTDASTRVRIVFW